MIVFHTDLDNTLIYSYRHDIGQDRICAEVYQGKGNILYHAGDVTAFAANHDTERTGACGADDNEDNRAVSAD